MEGEKNINTTEEPDGAEKYRDPADCYASITCWVSSSFDTGETSNNEKMFSDSDFKKLVESIGASNAGLCINILVQKKECYRRCLNTKMSSKNKSNNDIDTDRKQVLITVDVNPKDCGYSICQAIDSHYDKATIPVRVVLEE